MNTKEEQGGRRFQQLWIAGVKTHFPGAPEGYSKSWEKTDEWEQQSAATVYQQVRQFVLVGQTLRLSRKQKGQFVCMCWIAQIFKHISHPKESYITDWDQLPAWHQETYADIFEGIEAAVLQEAAYV